jgi:hypothetical protein
VNHGVIAAIVFAQFMDLGVTVVAPGNTVVCACGFDLVVLDFTVLQAFLLEPGLQESAAAAAAVVVGAVGLHVDEVFFAYHGFDHKPQVFGNGIPIAFPNDLAGVLHREFDLQVLVPVGVDFEFALTDPLGIVLINIFDFKVVFQVEFFQSGPD